jgi:SH3-like domain-containing protein
MLFTPGAHAEPAPVVDAGQPVYATLKSAPVNARVGPGEDYKAVWTYKAKGVPVQVIETAQDWRRICDPEGGLAWVRARVLESRRTVMRVKPSDLPLRRTPADDARVGAILAARATATLQTCLRGWCRITVDHTSGWARQSELWGVDEARQCR